MKKLAIIGAGPSGLISAKYALEAGLCPTLFEMSDEICGLWSSRNTAIWEGLRANTSRFIAMFSDHPWPSNTRIYPMSYEMRQYLTSYAERFGLDRFIRLNHKVFYYNY